MSHRTQPMPDLGDIRMPTIPLSNPEIDTHTRQDVTSPSTGPLLGFLLHFAKKDQDYLDVIKETDPKKLWGIGRKSIPEFCAPCPQDRDAVNRGPSGDGKKASDDGEVHDESKQDEEKLLNIVNGSGLPHPTKTYDVG